VDVDTVGESAKNTERCICATMKETEIPGKRLSFMIQRGCGDFEKIKAGEAADVALCYACFS
jgi:hypothetical protein